jgi:hypothetical protein
MQAESREFKSEELAFELSMSPFAAGALVSLTYAIFITLAFGPFRRRGLRRGVAARRPARNPIQFSSSHPHCSMFWKDQAGALQVDSRLAPP